MRRILVVDDDETFCRALSLTLTLAGYQVITAENGSVALKRFQEEPVDLVITDLIMPEKEGFETIMELRKFQPDLPIIAMSGGGRVGAGDYFPIARHLGAAKVLAKPFTSREIEEAVAEVLG